MMNQPLGFSTLCIHGSHKRYDSTGAISTPIYQSATFTHKSFGESTGFDYSRLQNPTREAVEMTLAKLEDGADAIAFSTGMAAISALMELFIPGDHIIVSDDLYGGSYRLFQHISTKNGILFDFVNTSNVANIVDVIQQETKAILPRLTVGLYYVALKPYRYEWNNNRRMQWY